jgi:hypothetical protein
VVLLGPGCKLVRGPTAESGVRLAGIVIEPPGFNDPPRRRQATEHLVEALITEAPVEALDKSVLDRLSGRDVDAMGRAARLPTRESRGKSGGTVTRRRTRSCPLHRERRIRRLMAQLA